MTDTSPQPSIADAINATVKSAPELGQSPGLAVGIASSGGDTPARAQAVARGTNAITDATAKQNVSHSVGGDISGALNWLGNSVAHTASDVAHPIEAALSPVSSAVGKVLNAPMAQVQHEYRYLHDVEARHGQLAALSEGIGIAGGAALGFAGGGVYGAELGAEGATALEGQFFYKDSWSRTSNGNSYTDPHTHMQVSFGRDIASAIGLRPGTLTFNVGSGLIDGIADLQVGGSEVAGLVGKARSVEGATGALGRFFPGISAATAEDFEQSYLRYGSVQRTMQDIAGKTAGEIIATPAYQSLMQIGPRTEADAARGITGNSFVQALGNARTADDVAEVFRDALRTHELVGMDKIPTLSFTRVPFQTLREVAESSDVGLSVARKFIRLPSAVDASGQISTKVFDPNSTTDNGATGLFRLLMYVENRRTAASVVDNYINANLEGKIRIYRNAAMNTLLAMSKEFGGDPDRLNANDLKFFKEKLDNFTGGAEPGAEGFMGLDDEGRNLSPVQDTSDANRQYAAAITDNQTGKLRFIQLSEMRGAAHTVAGYRNLYGNQLGLFGNARAEIAKADGFLYNHVTQNLFKPLVLLTPSYAMHIALAELIPNTLRLGVRNMAKAGIAVNMAKLGSQQMSGDEINAVSGLAWRLLGRSVTKDLTSDPESLSKMGQRVQLAARYIEFFGGDAVDPAISSGHNLSAEVERETRSTNLLEKSVANTPTMKGSTFGKFGRESENYVDAWHEWLNTDLVKDEKTRLAARTLQSRLAAGATLDDASRDAAASVSTWLHAQPQSYLDQYLRANPTSKSVAGELPLGMDQLDDWAHVVVSNLRGATRAANHGPVNTMLLERIANGEHIDVHTLDAIPEEMRPINVKGRNIVTGGKSNIIRFVANNGFQHLLNPMVNFISRQPIGFAEFEKQYNRELPYIARGLKTEDEAMVNAAAKTSQIVIRNVHNLTDRTQWTTTLRNWAPFFFAQEQAYRRMGRLLASDPRAFRQYQLMISNIHDVGQVLGGQNGQGYFVVPHTGWLTPGVVSGASNFFPITGSSPVGMGWNLNSMSVIFPTSDGVRPDLGPVVAVPIQAISDFFPEMGAPALKADVSAGENAVLGSSASTPLWEQLVPNTILDRLLEAANGGQFVPDRSFSSTVMQTMAALDYEGKLPTGPDVSTTALQQAADRIRNQTRIWYVAKALLGAITPVSPEIQVSGSNLRTEYDADVAAWDIATTGQGTLKQSGFSMNQLGFPKALNDDIKSAGSLSKGIQEYLKKNPDATAASVFEQVNGPASTAFTVAQSGTPTGEYLTASTQAEQWINNHAALIKDYPMAAIYLMPQLTDTKYNSTIYNEQLAQGLRAKLSPDQSTQDGALPSYINQLYIAAGNAQFYGPNGPYTKYLASINGLTPGEKYPLEQSFYNTTLPAFQKQNPIWGAYYTADPKSQDREQAVSQLQDMFRAGNAPAGPLTDEVKTLLDGYQNYQQQITYGTQDNFAGESQSAIKDAWSGYLQNITVAHPELRAFVQGVFQTLPSASGDANG